MVCNQKDMRIDIQRLTKLPTLSYRAEKILNLTSKELTHLDELVYIIEKDPPIMSKVLGIANIVYLGHYKPITTVKEALFTIGFKTLKNIALSISIFSFFKSTQEKEKSYIRLFRHSVATGAICQIISEKFLKEASEENFTAGVLHDIGWFALHYAFYDHFKKIEEGISQEVSLNKVELNITGTTHTEIGKWLAETWGLPEIVCDAIFYHHDLPQNSMKYSKAVALVQLSNFIAGELGYPPFEVKVGIDFYKDKVYQILKLPDTYELISEVQDIIKEVENL